MTVTTKIESAVGESDQTMLIRTAVARRGNGMTSGTEVKTGRGGDMTIAIATTIGLTQSRDMRDTATKGKGGGGIVGITAARRRKDTHLGNIIGGDPVLDPLRELRLHLHVQAEITNLTNVTTDLVPREGDHAVP